MTIELMLPNGAAAALDSLNDHDLRQYYMYQMDMLTQVEDIFESLGVSGWLDGQSPKERVVVERRSSPDGAFLTAPSAGNRLPTFYDAEQWQGMTRENDRVHYPNVSKMTPDQLRLDIARQHFLLQNFQQGAVANFAKNIADATQPPLPAMDGD